MRPITGGPLSHEAPQPAEHPSEIPALDQAAAVVNDFKPLGRSPYALLPAGFSGPTFRKKVQGRIYPVRLKPNTIFGCGSESVRAERKSSETVVQFCCPSLKGRGVPGADVTSWCGHGLCNFQRGALFG